MVTARLSRSDGRQQMRGDTVLLFMFGQKARTELGVKLNKFKFKILKKNN